MIAAMTDRGLPIVDGAPACPFVAFEDDRDGRALAPDHRHRCFAEPRPAPRALAHQEAYCLSSAFPVCPTFQDWARREAAAARPGPGADDADHLVEPPVSRPMPPRDRDPRHAPDTDTPPPIAPRRNPRRDWAAPPPWSGEEDGDDEETGLPGFLAGRAAGGSDEDWTAASRGLAGSAADRLAGPDPDAAPALPRAHLLPEADGPDRLPADDDLDDRAARPARASSRPADRQPQEWGGRRPDQEPGRPDARRPAAGARREQVHRRPPEEPEDLFGPAWERPQRYEAYPTLRTRVGLPSLPGFSRLGMSVVALVLAGAVLFFAGPMLLGLGGNAPGPGADVTPSPSADASATPIPTAVPAPTPTTYLVVQGDTMSKIATKFGVTVDAIMAANPQIKDANKIAIGDEITIPVPTPTSLPNQVSESASP